MPFDRESPTPLHIQISNQLRAAIASGELKSGDQLPSERDLTEQYNISRVTVRAALTNLEHEGLIFSRPGKGRYVSKQKIDQQLIQLTGFSEDIQKLALRPLSKVLSREAVGASEELASHLQVSTGARVFIMVRLRLADGIPLAIEKAHLPIALCPDILEQDFETGSLYAYLRQRGLGPRKARQTLSAGIPTAEERRLLELQGEAAVMRMERTTYLISNQPIEYVESVYRGDKFQFNVSLTSGSQSGMSGEAI
jgi:GntR family transcriptional regulator